MGLHKTDALLEEFLCFHYHIQNCSNILNNDEYSSKHHVVLFSHPFYFLIHFFLLKLNMLKHFKTKRKF